MYATSRLKLSSAALAVAVLGLTACSSDSPKATEAKADASNAVQAVKSVGPAEPVSGKTAFYEMYTPAHKWAADMVPLSLKSGEVKGVRNAGGKAGFWTATFGSPSLKQAATYTYSVADDPDKDIKQGAKPKGTIPWSGPTTASMPITSSDVTVDSDAAYKSAAEKAGAWLKEGENASKPVSISLGAAQRFPAPVWYLLFGSEKSGFAAYVNASTGNIIAK